METFRCRTVKPTVSDWFSLDASSFEDAANTFHIEKLDKIKSLKYRHELTSNSLEIIYFARVEVENHGFLISRVYQTGIWRRGGIKTPSLTLSQIASLLEYENNPETLLDSWQCEETWDEAREKKKCSWCVDGIIKQTGLVCRTCGGSGKRERE